MHKMNLVLHIFKIEELRRKVSCLIAQSMTESEIVQEFLYLHQVSNAHDL
jgi:hypothetical protein